MRVFRWLRSGRITTQITLLVFLSGVVGLGVTSFVFFRLSPEEKAPPALQRSAARVGTLLRALERLPPASRAELAAAYTTGDLTIDLAPAVSPSSALKQAEGHMLAPVITRELPSGAKIKAIIDEAGNRVAIVVGLADGTDVLVH